MVTHHVISDKKILKCATASAIYAIIYSISIQIYAEWEITPLEKCFHSVLIKS